MVTISVSEGLLVPVFCVLRVKIVISVIGGGGAGGCGCVPSTECSVGGGVRSMGLVPVVGSFSPLMGESCVSGMDVGLAGGGVYG